MAAILRRNRSVLLKKTQSGEHSVSIGEIDPGAHGLRRPARSIGPRSRCLQIRNCGGEQVGNHFIQRLAVLNAKSLQFTEDLGVDVELGTHDVNIRTSVAATSKTSDPPFPRVNPPNAFLTLYGALVTFGGPWKGGELDSTERQRRE